MNETQSFDGKVIAITGGGSGLGYAMAKYLLSQGAKIAICGRSEKKLADAQKSLAQFGQVLVHACDVREESEVEAFFSKIYSDFSRLDALVNNAAGNFYSASEDLSSNGFRSIVDTVLVGTFHCSQAAAKLWIEQNSGGCILNIVTTYAHMGSAFVLPSACAKAGVATMTTSLAYEWAEYGIRVNGVAPGPIPTEGAWKRLVPNADFEELYRKRLPMKRFGTPEELAKVVAFLLSDQASYINGAILPMDGGEHLQGGEFNFLTQMMPREELRALFTSMKPKK